MKRLIIALGLLLALTLPASQAHAIVGVTLKLGGTFIPNGSVPGGIVQAHIGPISPFAEFYKKSGVTTTNLGVNFIFLKLPFPVLSPYIGAGGGISRSSGGGVSKSRTLVDGIGGIEVKLSPSLRFFGQVKYLYTLGSGVFVTRDVALQGGLVFHLGI